MNILDSSGMRSLVNEELKSIPVNQAYYEFDKLFSDQEEFSLFDGAHWLIDGNLYGLIGVNRITEIYEDDTDQDLETLVINEEPKEVEEEEEFLEINDDEVVKEEFDKIDL